MQMQNAEMQALVLQNSARIQNKSSVNCKSSQLCVTVRSHRFKTQGLRKFPMTVRAKSNFTSAQNKKLGFTMSF